jgi:hypothetical protein
VGDTISGELTRANTVGQGPFHPPGLAQLFAGPKVALLSPEAFVHGHASIPGTLVISHGRSVGGCGNLTGGPEFRELDAFTVRELRRVHRERDFGYIDRRCFRPTAQEEKKSDHRSAFFFCRK